MVGPTKHSIVEAALRSDNRRMLGKLLVVATLMFAFGYALVPVYRAVCNALGINVLAVSELAATGGERTLVSNTQVDFSRKVVIEFDANARGPWEFRPALRSLDVHPGQLTTVMYEFRNRQNRSMVAQAIPSYAPLQAASYFTKLECFCFEQHSLAPGESKKWPVVFVIDSELPQDVTTITLSYTFFEVGGTVPAAPVTVKAGGAQAHT